MPYYNYWVEFEILREMEVTSMDKINILFVSTLNNIVTKIKLQYTFRVCDLIPDCP